MAKVLGKAGRYVEEQSVKKTQAFVLWSLISVAVLGAAFGFDVALMIYAHRFPWLSALFLLALCAAVFFGNRHFSKKLDAIERERISFRKGAVGEALIAGILKGLPEDYVVINDLTKRYGNIDHVVVGPTGVFIIDTKNWKGIVEADGNGELLLNGKPTSKTEVRNLVVAAMSCREQVVTLCQAQRLESELFVRAVLAFPSARVEAKWGTVKNAVCVSDESLVDYIEKNKPKETLSKKDIDSISHAFQLLAQMDRGFDALPVTKAANQTPF